MNGIQHLADILREQATEWKEHPKGKFHLRITDEEIRRAIVTIPAEPRHAEAVLDEAVRTIATGFVSADTPLMISLVTRALCPTRAELLPTRHAYITRVFEVGRRIPEEQFRGFLESLDHLLSAQYKPSCAFCEHGTRKKKHTTGISFLRYVPSPLLPLLHVLDNKDRSVNHLEFDAASAHPLLRAHIDGLLHKAYAGRKEAFYDLATGAGRMGYALAMVSSRIKGDDRLALKIVRLALGIESREIKDRYGMKFLGVDSAAAMDIVTGIEGSLRARRQPVLVERVDLEDEVSRWNGYKISASFRGSAGLTIPLSIHVQDPDEFYHDTIGDPDDALDRGHSFFEERQREMVERKREEGWPTGQMYSEVARILSGKHSLIH